MKSSQRMGKATNESADEVQDEIEALRASLKELRGDVVDLVSHAFGIGRGGAHVAKDTAADAVEQLKAKIAEIKGRGGDGLAAVERRIEQRPIHAALIAFGLGFVAALLFSRR